MQVDCELLCRASATVALSQQQMLHLSQLTPMDSFLLDIIHLASLKNNDGLSDDDNE